MRLINCSCSDWLSVWCIAFYVDFGHVRIPRNLNVPPSLRMLGIEPQSKLNCEVCASWFLLLFHLLPTLATYPYAIKNQRKARNAPSRGLWVPWAGSLWHKRAGVATLWATHFITIWYNSQVMKREQSFSLLLVEILWGALIGWILITVLLGQHSSAIKNQLKAPKAPY